MSRVFSKSVLCAFTLLALATAACGTSKTDDVYTADEQRPDVGPVARDQVAFPIPAGAMVPDANGNAIALRPGMLGVRVRFHDILVNGTCDSGDTDDGEFYYDLGVDGRTVARRNADHYVSASVDDAIAVSASRVFFVGADEPFSVRLDVSEADDFMNGKDDHVGADSEVYDAGALTQGAIFRSVELGSGDCDVTVEYEISRVQ